MFYNLYKSSPYRIGWLRQHRQRSRLHGSHYRRAGRPLEGLDDEFLLNRQFARKGLEEMLGIELADFGYRFHMGREARGPVIARIRRVLLDRARTVESP